MTPATNAARLMPSAAPDQDWLSGLHPYSPALFASVSQPPAPAQPYVVKLVALRDGASVFAWNQGGLAIAAARAGVAYLSGPRVQAEAEGAPALSQAQAIGWLRTRRRTSAWEPA